VSELQPFSRDTSPEVQSFLVERWRSMGFARKAALVTALSLDCDRLAIAGIRERRPDALPDEIHRELAMLKLGRDLAQRALAAGNDSGR
jgi:hypothetical protein